jgi:hypothetical protein
MEARWPALCSQGYLHTAGIALRIIGNGLAMVGKTQATCFQLKGCLGPQKALGISVEAPMSSEPHLKNGISIRVAGLGNSGSPRW